MYKKVLVEAGPSQGCNVVVHRSFEILAGCLGPDWGKKLAKRESKGEMKCSDGSMKEMKVNAPKGLAAIIKGEPIHQQERVLVEIHKDKWHEASREEKRASLLNALTNLNNTSKFLRCFFNLFLWFLAVVDSSIEMEGNKYCS